MPDLARELSGGLCDPRSQLGHEGIPPGNLRRIPPDLSGPLLVQLYLDHGEPNRRVRDLLSPHRLQRAPRRIEHRSNQGSGAFWLSADAPLALFSAVAFLCSAEHGDRRGGGPAWTSRPGDQRSFWRPYPRTVLYGLSGFFFWSHC